jgi:tetratricopeptide (TPR) repeat protein
MIRDVLTLSLCLVLTGVASADDALGDVAALFSDGVRHYEAKNYRAATQAFKTATAAVPDNDEYVYWLGKAYGRQAEQAGWFKALKLAKLTRAALERAVALNPQNWDAVRDLAQYYTDAPGFLGGDKTKAAALRARLNAAPARSHTASTDRS